MAAGYVSENAQKKAIKYVFVLERMQASEVVHVAF